MKYISCVFNIKFIKSLIFLFLEMLYICSMENNIDLKKINENNKFTNIINSDQEVINNNIEQLLVENTFYNF